MINHSQVVTIGRYPRRIDTHYTLFEFEHRNVERRVNQFFIGLSDAPNYDIIWTENENLIEHCIPEILAFKTCPTHV